MHRKPSNSNSSSFCADYRRVTQNDMNTCAMLFAECNLPVFAHGNIFAALIHDDNFYQHIPVTDWRRTRNGVREKEKEIRNYNVHDKNNPSWPRVFYSQTSEQGCYINSKTMNIASSLIEKLNPQNILRSFEMRRMGIKKLSNRARRCIQ